MILVKSKTQPTIMRHSSVKGLIFQTAINYQKLLKTKTSAESFAKCIRRSSFTINCRSKACNFTTYELHQKRVGKIFVLSNTNFAVNHFLKRFLKSFSRNAYGWLPLPVVRYLLSFPIFVAYSSLIFF